MFESMKERKRQRQEEREQLIREEKNRLLSLSEKELLVEILFELKRIKALPCSIYNSFCSSVSALKIRINSSNSLP